jgi:hypothetical protein
MNYPNLEYFHHMLWESMFMDNPLKKLSIAKELTETLDITWAWICYEEDIGWIVFQKLIEVSDSLWHDCQKWFWSLVLDKKDQ